MKKLTDLKEGDLLTAEAASKILGIAKRTLYDWHAKSKIEPEKYVRGVKLGGHLFFLKSELIDRLNRQQSHAS